MSKPDIKTVGEVAAGESSTVRVSTFVGKDGIRRVDIRLFVAGKKYTGPTKKGCAIPIEKVPELVKILESVK